MDGAAQVVLVLVVAAGWLFSAVHAGRDPSLHPQARSMAFLLILFVPIAAIVYWATRRAPAGPFMVSAWSADTDSTGQNR
jgi:hypothetical protein